MLTAFYERVTIIDRDVPEPGKNRRGAPQGRHAHNLLPAGAKLMDQIFPGIVTEMGADGAVVADMLVGYRFYLGGKQLPQVPVGAKSVHATLPFYEDHLRRRLRERGGVRFMPGTDVMGITADDAGAKVTGVLVSGKEPGGGQGVMAAELVVDAMGRSRRTPAWLKELGYERPPEEQVAVDIAYVSRLLRLSPTAADRVGLLVGGDINGTPRGILLLAVEGNRYLLTATGAGPEHRPPTDEAGYAEFLTTAAPPDVLEAIRDAEPLGEIAAHRFPAAVWRRYDRLDRFPAGLLVIGEALCSLSPLNAQGLTAAAMEAVELQRCLAAGREDLSMRFFRAAARKLAPAWEMTVNVAAPDTPSSTVARLRGRFMDRVVSAATRDNTVAAQFARVFALLDPPTALLRPRVLWRVAVSGMTRDRETRRTVAER
ncbi:hypothetical protein [Actinoplanes sp. NPDC049265]|uniref:hypothetical protein n=1 Tax=Actinoplanes sp. NPDC049265 TaxID=3363902 RepID=UPI0037124DEB